LRLGPTRDRSEEVKKKVSSGTVNLPPPRPNTTKPTTKVAIAPERVTSRRPRTNSAKTAAASSATHQSGRISFIAMASVLK
jgi:hypothetical protein